MDSVNVLWVAESNFPQNTGIKPHKHDYYHLFFVREGPLEIAVSDKLHSINNGESALFLPGMEHAMSNMDARVIRCYEVKFSVSNAVVVGRLSSLPLKLPDDGFVASLIRELVAESACGSPSSPAIAANYLLVLIHYLYRIYGMQEVIESSKIDITGFSQLSRDIVRYMEDNYQNEVSLQEIADAVGLNKNYICTAFKRESGVTIGHCLTVLRIRKAAELISFSDMKLSQVSDATGFANLSHFNRVFRKIVGIPPGQYRQMFPADILIPGDAKSIGESIEHNGFIASVMGGKKLSIADIISQMGLAGSAAPKQ